MNAGSTIFVPLRARTCLFVINRSLLQKAVVQERCDSVASQGRSMPDRGLCKALNVKFAAQTHKAAEELLLKGYKLQQQKCLKANEYNKLSTAGKATLKLK